MRAAVAIALLLGSATASADTFPGPLPPAPIMVPPPPPSLPDPAQGPKSEKLALLISVVATAGPPLLASAIYSDHNGQLDNELLATIGVSVLFGPTVGHWYSGKVITPGLGVRALGFVALAAVASSDAGETDSSIGLLLVGGALVIGGGLHDLATLGRSAREYNVAHATRLMPVVAPTIGSDGRTQLKLGLTGSF